MSDSMPLGSEIDTREAMLPESVDLQHIAALRIFNHRRKEFFNTIGLTRTSRPGRGMSVLIPGSGQSSGHLGGVPAWANECHLSQLLARSAWKVLARKRRGGSAVYFTLSVFLVRFFHRSF